MTDRNVTIGAGPFQPPSPSELAQVREQAIAEKARADRLASDLQRAYALLNVETADDLSALLYRVLPDEASDVVVDTDLDGDLTINAIGVTANDDGYITPKEQEFEVDFEVTIRGSFSVTAKSEEDADDIVTDVFPDFVNELRNIEPAHAEIDSVYIDVNEWYFFTG